MPAKPYNQFASEIGYQKSNIISMFKTGETKVPMHIVGKFAKAVGSDPAHLLRIYLNEYAPELLATVEECLGTVLTTNEKELIDKVRDCTKHHDPRFNVVVLGQIKKVIQENGLDKATK